MLTDRDSMLRQLHELRSEHRDLDTVIARLAEAGSDQLHLQRLKKRKLLLKDGDLDRGAKRVIERCRELGAPDNISVAVARFEVDVTKTQALPRLKKIGLMQKGAGH